MSAEHRRPAVAFVVLALVAAGVVGIQRAEAQGGRLLAAVIGAGASVHGTLPPAEPLADSVLDTGLLAGGSFLVLPDVSDAEAVEAETDLAGRPAVRGVAVAREAQRPAGTASGPSRRDKADHGRATRTRDGGKREVPAAGGKARSAERRASAKPVPAATHSRASNAAATSSSRSHLPASAPRTVSPPRRPVVRQDHRPVRVRVGHHGRVHKKAHRTARSKAHRSADRAASRKAFRR